MNNFDVKKKIVLDGKSKVFNNWSETTGISVETFLQGLEWVCGDPMETFVMKDGTAVERMTRELAVINCKDSI